MHFKLRAITAIWLNLAEYCSGYLLRFVQWLMPACRFKRFGIKSTRILALKGNLEDRIFLCSYKIYKLHFDAG